MIKLCFRQTFKSKDAYSVFDLKRIFWPVVGRLNNLYYSQQLYGKLNSKQLPIYTCSSYGATLPFIWGRVCVDQMNGKTNIHVCSSDYSLTPSVCLSGSVEQVSVR